jgi:hypothetical protein
MQRIDEARHQKDLLKKSETKYDLRSISTYQLCAVNVWSHVRLALP